MALPLIILTLFLIIGTFLLLFGYMQLQQGAGMGFIILAGLLFLIAGLMLWTQGLQTNQISSISGLEAGDMININYTEISVSEGSELWVLSNLLFFGGVIILFLGLSRAFYINKAKKTEQANYY